jgi:UDP-glucose 4-epimerase
VKAAGSGTSARRPTVLVTGAAGLIGSAVVRLLGERESQVIACDDFSMGTWRAEGEGVIWEECDVADPSLPSRLDAYVIDAVVHAAAHPGGRSLEAPAENVRVNALGSMRVFEWCARARVPVVYLSSSAIYGEQPPSPISESAPFRPGTVYATCKVACENFLRVLGAGCGLRWTTLRLFATYGAGHRPNTYQGIVNVMLTQLLSGDRVVVRGSLDRVRDLMYVDDAARAIVDCLFDESTRGRALNVGTGVGVSVRELLGMLGECLGRPLAAMKFVEAAPTVGDPFYSVADVTELSRTGFKPQVGLRAGLERLVWERTRRDQPGASA